MSHKTGTLQPVTPNIIIGPDSGIPATSPNTWTRNFSPTPAPAPGGTKFVILHFSAASFPGNNKLVVQLGWGENDEFTTTDGTDFWTRPIKLAPDGTVTIHYIVDTMASGSATLLQYGRGEEISSNDNSTNLDLFFLDETFNEPLYETRGLCNPTPNWENVDCLPPADIRRTVSRSCGLSIYVHDEHVSTCSGTLIAADLVLTAGHCMSDPGGLEEASGSFCFNFESTCDGGKPEPHTPKFYKIKKVIRRKYLTSGSLDYCILQLAVPPVGIGITPIVMRPDMPAVGDEVFLIHHPQGVIKKVSANPDSSWATISDLGVNSGLSNYIYLRANTDLTGGSSGSSLFDNSGRIIGIADIDTTRKSGFPGACGNGILSITEVLKDLATSLPPTPTTDVMMVFDKSGSMSLAAGTGRTKIEEARDAASLFVQLIRAGAGHRIGLVSFSSAATNPIDFSLSNVDGGAKNLLIGTSSPFSGGIVGGISPGGLTSIGGGLEAARTQFPVPGANRRTILLLTDGLQNTAPMIEDVEPALSGIDLNVIGFGSEASLDGIVLNRLAQAHNGLYTRAGDSLDLKKFFAMSFGNIFGAGTLVDPNFFISASQFEAKPFPFIVCSEDEITVVVGWDNPESFLRIKLLSPTNQVITPASSSVTSSTGKTWTFLKITMPYAGERDGEWNVVVERVSFGGEFPPPQVDLHYFINVVVKGGPRLNYIGNNRPHFTGDVLHPLIQLVNSDGTIPHNAEVTVTLKRPVNSIGNLLTNTQMEPNMLTDADAISSRHATLLKLEQEKGGKIVDYIEETFKLFDDGKHGDGAMEPDGIFGDIINEKLTTEGNYTYRAVATYGDGCEGRRELFWSHYVNCGIDPSQSDLETKVVETLPDGKQRVILILTPKDKYGNNLGAGRADDILVSGSPGNILDSGVIDNGNGTYEVIVIFDPNIGKGPGVIVTQPGRPPVIFGDTTAPQTNIFNKYKSCISILIVLLLVIILILFFIILS